MATENQTVHTVFTAEANLKAAEAELRELSSRFTGILSQMGKGIDAVDAKTLGVIRNFNKAMGTLQQAQRTLQGLGVQPDRLGARNRSDIKGEAASMAGDLLSYRKTVSRALAGTVLEIDDQIKKLNDAYARLGRNRRKNARELAETQAEIDRLTRTRSTIAGNPYVGAELTGARGARAQANLRRAASDDRAAMRAAEDLAASKIRLLSVESELATLDARRGGRAPARIGALRQEQQTLRELIASYEAVTAVVQKYDQNYARLSGGAFIKNDRQLVTDARNYLQMQERVGAAKQRIAAMEAGQLRMDQVELNNLSNEVRLAERLLHIHEQDAGVMARVQAIRDRSNRPQQSRFDRTTEEMRANPGGLMGIQTEVMANYAALSAAQTGAAAIWNFAVKDESALAQFRAIAAASGSETARLAEDMRALGTNTKYTNLEIAETATLLAQAGLSARDTGPALEAIATLATAAGVELRQAADVVTSIQNIWSYNVSQMGDIANVLTSALNQTKLGMDQMQLGIQYAGNSAADAGVDFVELTSIMGAMAQAGIRSGSTIGTGLRALVVDLQNPTEKTLTTLNRLGLSMADVDVRTLGLTQVLHNLKDAGFTSADAMGAFEVRAAAAFSAISNNLNVVDSLQTSLYDSDAAAQANAIQMDTLAARWTAFANVATAMGAEALKPVVEFLKELLIFGTGVLGMLNSMMPVVQGVTVALIAMFATFALSRMGLAIGALGNMVSSLRLVAPAAAASTVALEGSAVAAAGFGGALSAIPIVGWIGIAAGLITTVISLAGGFDTATDRADALEGAINDLQSELMETETTIKSVDDATERLRNQYTALANNDVMRERLLNQTRQRFAALGLEIKEGANSVDDMIEALGRLRTELNREFESQLLTLADRLDERIALMNDQITGGTVLSREDKDRAKLLDPRIGTDTPARQRIRRLMRGETTLGEDYSVDDYRLDMGSLRTQRDQLANSARNLPPGSAQRTRADEQLRALREFISIMGRFEAHLGEIARVRTQEQEAEENARYQGALAGPTANERLMAQFGYEEDLRTGAIGANRTGLAGAGSAVAVRTELERMLQAYEPRRSAIERSSADAASKGTQLTALRDAAITEAFNFLESKREDISRDPQMGPFAERFLGEMDTYMRERVNQLFRSATAYEEQGARQSRASGRTAATARDDAQDLERRVATAERADLEARMNAIEARLQLMAQNGATPREINALAEEWRGLNEQRTAAARAEKRAQLQASGMYDRRGGLELPVSGQVSSEYSLRRRNPVTGRMQPHQGMDIAVGQGTRVNAAGSGTVSFAGQRGGYGNVVEIDHGNGVKTLYAHLSQIIATQVGQAVERGTQIGLSGGAPGTPGAGSSTGAHLHFGVYRNGRAVDPRTALGARTAGADGDPGLNRLASLEWSRFEAEEQGKADDFARNLQEWLGNAVFDPLEAELKARRDTNNRTIQSLTQGIAEAGDASTTLDEITEQVRARVLDNMSIARRLLVEDPENAGRLNSATFQAEVANEVLQEMLKGADALDNVYEGFVALQERLGTERMAGTQGQLRIAGATAGTSETTAWLLNQRLEMEEYQTALDVVTASEAAYTDALARRAEAETAVANATLALQAAMASGGNETAIASARVSLDMAQQALDRIRQAAAAAGVRLGQARIGADAARPIGPISSQSRDATAAGIDPVQYPMRVLTAAVDRYRDQSGVMTGIAQTVADGIYSTFSALGAGIEKTINEIADGSITIRGLFANIFGGVLKELQTTAAKIAANWIMQYILKTVMGTFGPISSTPYGSTNVSPMQGQSLPMGSGIPRLKHGGEVKRRALGGGTPGRDSVHLLAEPGEYMMRKSAVDFVGRDTLDTLNALGNRRLSSAGARVALPPPREKDEVNVWLVPQSQVPPPGPKDIIHTVGQSMMHGELKTLVKRVTVGG